MYVSYDILLIILLTSLLISYQLQQFETTVLQSVVCSDSLKNSKPEGLGKPLLVFIPANELQAVFKEMYKEINGLVSELTLSERH